MELGELPDYDLPAGRVTSWVAAAPPEALLVDERPFSPQHQSHAQGYHPDADPSWIGVAFVLPYRFDEEAVAATLTEWHARHEAFRTTAVLRDGQLMRVTAPQDEVAVRAIGQLECPSRAASCERILEFFASTVSPMSWPPTAVATVDVANGEEFCVVVGGDHGAFDAYSAFLAIAEIDTIYRAYITGQDPTQVPFPELPVPPEVSAAAHSASSYPDFSASEYARGLRLPDDYATLGRWAYLLGPDRRFPSFPVASEETSALDSDRPHWQASVSQRVLTGEQAGIVHAKARAAGYGMTTQVLAAVSRALARAVAQVPGAMPLESLDIVLPMHTRNEDVLHAMGWFVGVAPLHVDLRDLPALTDAPGSDLPGELLERVEQALEPVRRDAQVPVAVVAERLGVCDSPRFVISYVDVRFMPGAQTFAERKAMALRSAFASNEDVYLWVFRSTSSLTVSSRYPAHNEISQSARAFIDGVGEELRALAAGPN